MVLWVDLTNKVVGAKERKQSLHFVIVTQRRFLSLSSARLTRRAAYQGSIDDLLKASLLGLAHIVVLQVEKRSANARAFVFTKAVLHGHLGERFALVAPRGICCTEKYRSF